MRGPTDDIHPHAVLVRREVAQPPEAVPEGLLTEDLVAGGTSLVR